MEMTFPQFLPRADNAMRTSIAMILATVTARQASSRTASVVRRQMVQLGKTGDAAMQRIRYFAHPAGQGSPVCGAFWQDSVSEVKREQPVYQAGSMNIKVRDLLMGATGEQFNHAGHGVMRKS